MRAFAKLRKQGDVTISARKKLLEQHYQKVQAKLYETQLNLKKIEEKIKIYSKMEKLKSA